MGSFSWIHWLVVLAIVLLLFGGRGKISQIMGDFGKGLKAFKKGVAGEGEQPADAAVQPAKPISGTAAAADNAGAHQKEGPVTRS